MLPFCRDEPVGDDERGVAHHEPCNRNELGDKTEKKRAELIGVMIWSIDQPGRHAHALEGQADGKDQCQQVRRPPPALPLAGVQQGEREASQGGNRCQQVPWGGSGQ